MTSKTNLSIIATRTNTALQRHTNTWSRYQIQATTGKKLNSVSENAPAKLSVLERKSALSDIQAQIDLTPTVQARIDEIVSILQQAHSIVADLRSNVLQAASSTNNRQQLDTFETQANDTIKRVFDLLNSKSQGGYLLSGATPEVQPFAVTGRDANGAISAVSYAGSKADLLVHFTDNFKVPVGVAGGGAIQATQRQRTIFQGSTGARAGSAVDSARGSGSLIIRHNSTTYSPGSGVAPGSSSSTGDTVLGTMGTSRLQITDQSGVGAFGTVSLNGGAPVPFTSASTNLQVNAANGDFVFLDMSAITPGFSGDVDLQGSGEMTIDGGLTFSPVTFTNNQVMLNSVDNSVTFVDTTQVRRPGVDQLTYPGTFNLFEIMIEVRNELAKPASTEQSLRLSSLVSEIDTVQSRIAQAIGTQSSQAQSLQQVNTRNEDQMLYFSEAIGNLENADLSEVVIKLQEQETMIQLTMGSFARIFQTSLLDFLR